MSDSMCEWPSEKRSTSKQVETMTDQELDAELRANGIDPEQMIQNAFQKVCVIVKTQSERIGRVEAENAKLMRTRVPSEEFEQVRFERDESRRENAALKEQLAEARKTVQWTPITLENLPKIGDEVLEIWVMSERRNLSIATYDWNEEDMKYYTKHAKAYSRPINPPKDTPSKQDAEKAYCKLAYAPAAGALKDIKTPADPEFSYTWDQIEKAVGSAGTSSVSSSAVHSFLNDVRARLNTVEKTPEARVLVMRVAYGTFGWRVFVDQEKRGTFNTEDDATIFRLGIIESLKKEGK